MSAAGVDGTGQAILQVSDLSVEFSGRNRRSPLRAVDRVSFDIRPRETVGLVGQSGSGKSTIGRAILGLTPVAEGHINFCGADITRASFRERRALSARLQCIFQDPYSSLNPTRTIRDTLGETLRVHLRLSADEREARVREALARVGLPADAGGRYPTQFSGGQRQRIAIARALMLRPSLVICDEPATALDLSVQAQVLNLLAELQRDLGISYLFIAHDLTLVRYLSHRIVVLRGGRVVESGTAEDVYRHPTQAYTQRLLAAAPIPDPTVQRGRSFAVVENLRIAESCDPSGVIPDNASMGTR
jgi:ABC-type glutathione transport system ATPase component